MVRGMGVEVAGTEHVATARFDITRCHVEIRFGRFLLRRRGEIDEACSQRKERKQEESRHTTHDPSNRFIENGGPTGNYPTLLSEYGGFNWISLLLKPELLNWLALARKLHRFPEDTVVQFNFQPTLRAKLAVSKRNASAALESLRGAAPYELGTPASRTYTSYWTALYPVYVRGEAYLAAHKGSEAAAEFHKILDHRGIVLNSLIGALAHLQLGRAYAMQGDTAKAKAAYQDFLTLWRDADPDIPIFIAAKSEYAKLR
jgi:hypothetical protein